MDWSSLFAAIYLLGVLFTAAVTAKPIRRIMGWDRPGDHADADSANDARMIVAFAVCGVAAIWPLTLPMYIASRIIPASAEHDDDDQGVALVLAGPE
jgi:hypothetical protein